MKNLLRNIKEQNILLELVDGELKVFADKTPDPELVAEIRKRKTELVHLLSANLLAGTEDAPGDRIPKAPEHNSYVLSSAQRRLWVLSQLQEDNGAYNLWGAHVFEGLLQRQALEYAVQSLVHRHESLRTVFRMNAEGEVRQFIMPAGSFNFSIGYYDLREDADRYEKLKTAVKNSVNAPFDLSAGPLLRISLYQVEDHRWTWVHTLHHIISDFWSMDVLISELLSLYNAKIKGEPAPLPPLRIQYKDYAVWQQQQLQGEGLRHSREYWLKRFEDGVPLLYLTGDHPRPAVKSYNGGSVSWRHSAELGNSIKDVANGNGCTLFMALLASVNTLLYRYTGQTDIVIGSSMASREHAELENQIGFYVNTLALRTRFSGSDSYAQLLQRVKEVTLGAYDHQAFPFDELTEALNIERDRSRHPLFDVMVVLQTAAQQQHAEEGMSQVMISGYKEIDHVVNKFDLTFFFTDTGSDLLLRMVYNKDIYEAATVSRMAAHLEGLLRAAISAPHEWLGRLDYMSAEEKQQLLQTARSEVNYTQGETIPDLFKRQVDRSPATTAVACGESQLSYEQLDRQSSWLSVRLQKDFGIGRGDIVGILLDRSVELIVSMMGILKSGAAYMVIEAENPRNRREYMLKNAGTKVLITQSAYLMELDYFEGGIIAIDIETGLWDNVKKPEVEVVPVTADDLAYVVYTSGTTGDPKGVMITHGNVVDYYYGLEQQTEIVTGNQSFGFISGAGSDLGNTMIYAALLSGGRLQVFRTEEMLDKTKLSQVDCIKIVPSHWKALQSGGELSLPHKMVVFGGEALSPAIVEAIEKQNSDCIIYNHYGPTETTIGKLAGRVNKKKITLGRPFGNTQVYILDNENNLLPPGAAGEICIAGRGVGKGYINNAGETALRFTSDPFDKSATLYRTGDLGRWTASGELEYIGRKDDQLKIRGYRVEPGEIEAMLKSYEGIDAAVVTAWQHSPESDKELVAYLVKKEPASTGTTTAALRLYLRGRLPEYMLPAHYVWLPEMPLTSNGKIDRRRLPGKEAWSESRNGNYVAPRNETEEKLVKLWQEVLGREEIGVQDNFFDMGGHSLRATRLVSLIHKTFEVNIGLKEIFGTLVLEQQAELIRKARKTSYQVIQPVVPAASGYKLSSAQYRLWVLSQFEEGNIAYNVSAAHVFEGDLDARALEHAFTSLVERHEILRTVFRENEEGEIRQFVLSPQACGFQIAFYDLRNAIDKDRQAEELVRTAFITPFDLAAGPLIRASLITVEENKWVFVYVMHHIISDGWSRKILINELLILYNAYRKAAPNPLQPLRIQYKDYANWEQEQLSSEALHRHQSYWLQQFEGELPVLEIPGDKIRPALKTYEGASYSRQYNDSLAKGIGRLAQEQDATLFMSLLAAVSILLYRYTGLEDIIIGTPIAGREHLDLEDQIGFYVNTLALRTRFNGSDNYRQLLDNVKQVALDAYEHHIYPFDKLVNDLGLQRDRSRHPLFDVQVIVDSARSADTGNRPGPEQVSVSGYEGNNPLTSVFDIVFHFTERQNSLDLHVVYNSSVYSSRSIEQLTDHLEVLLSSMIHHPAEPVKGLAMLRETEIEKLLNHFNNYQPQKWGHKTIMELFSAQVKIAPDAPAVVAGNKTLSYAMLEQRSSELAGYLKRVYDVKKEELVGVMLDRTEAAVIALLGIMKSGAAYVPIDPSYPQQRKEYMLRDSAVRILLTQTGYLFDLSWYQGEIVAMDLEGYSGDTTEAANVNGSDLAYVIYTSGSTGLPKGVMIGHRALSAAVETQLEVFDIARETRVLQFTSFSFDVSVFEMLITLLSGACLYIIDEESRKDALRMQSYINEHAIEMASIPPAFLRLLDINALNTLKKLVTGGEVVSTEQVNIFCQHGDYYNCYGPTESALCASIYPVSRGERVGSNIPIGTPLSHTRIYILDSSGNLVPVGVSGEICIGGLGVARGYLNQPQQTAQRFVDDPFEKGSTMYRTGDLGRWTSTGLLEFMGRKDSQLKINGYRVEPGEIEQAIKSYGSIQSAVVLGRDNGRGDKELVAWLVDSEPINPQELRAYLNRRLPLYMIPAHFVQLEALPLTPNGKTDTARLPMPEGAAFNKTCEGPRTEKERAMVRVWEEILGKQAIGITDDFFELGGDSIKILRMTAAFRKELNIDIQVTDIYSHTTIKELVAHISKNEKVLEARNEKIKAGEKQIRERIDALRQRILAEGKIPGQENIENIYPMSDIEKGMVYESLLNERLHLYHDQMVQRKIIRDFDIDRLRHAMQLMVEKHPILRTAFDLGSYETELQIVYKEIDQPITCTDLSGLPRDAQEKKVRDFMRSELQRPFNMTKAPLWRIDVFNFGKDEIVFVIQTHHAIMDGWSDASFRTELNNLYYQLIEDPFYKPTPLQSDYEDLIIQQETAKNNEAVKRFWKEELEETTKPDLFTDEEKGDDYSCFIGEDEYALLKQRAAELNATPKAIAFSAWLYLLKVLNYEPEIVTGLVTNNRPDREDGDKILGCFLNTIPFRFTIDDNSGCDAFIKNVYEKLLAIKAYESLHISEIATLHDKRTYTGNPFFDLIFNYVDFHRYNEITNNTTAHNEEMALPSLNVGGFGRTNTFLDFTINVTGNRFAIGISMRRKLRSGFSAARFATMYCNLLRQMVNAGNGSLGQLTLVDKAERQRLLVDFNQAVVDYPRNKTIAALFEEQVEATPYREALVCGDAVLSYQQLNNKANQLAHYLREQYNISPGCLVALQLERSEWLIIVILGVLKTGAAYVPIEPDLPAERRAHILSECRCSLLIDEAELQKFANAREHYAITNLSIACNATDLAYIMYTSGTMGRPRGVMIENPSVVRLVRSANYVSLTGNEVLLSTGAIAFDATTFEYWSMLLNGGKLVLCPASVLLDDQLLAETIEKNKISIMWFTAGWLNQLVEKNIQLFRGLKTILAGGDKLSVAHINLLQQHYPTLTIINGYGPTENTTFSLTYTIQQGDDPIPIGKPISNSTAYILDQQLRLLPVGVMGEIFVAGDGLARGYINNAGLTAEKFISHPFNKDERIYSTGDLGKFLPDGNILFMGRRDAQVKIRGYRVETDEIENRLQQHPAIDSAVVVAKPAQDGGKELIAYLVANGEINVTELRSWLSQALPAYMMPQYFVPLDAMPLNRNGKVDKRKLPDPSLQQWELSDNYVAPRNETEEKLVAIWQELLGKEKIGVKDNFFETGGHSLKIMRLSARIHQEFNLKIKMQDLFNKATIEEIANEIRREGWVEERMTEPKDDLVPDQSFIL